METEERVLSRGTNFCFTQKPIPAIAVVPQIENALRMLPDDVAETTRRSVSSVLLNRGPHPKMNFWHSKPSKEAKASQFFEQIRAMPQCYE